MSEPFLPLLFKVSHRSYDASAENDLGNEVEAWNDPEEWEVYGWGPPEFRGVTKEVVGADGGRYIVHVELLVPPGIYARDRDRIQLGSLAEIEAAPDNYEWYRVVGPTEDYSHSPFGWNPGNVINLVTVEGAGL